MNSSNVTLHRNIHVIYVCAFGKRIHGNRFTIKTNEGVERQKKPKPEMKKKKNNNRISEHGYSCSRPMPNNAKKNGKPKKYWLMKK